MSTSKCLHCGSPITGAVPCDVCGHRATTTLILTCERTKRDLRVVFSRFPVGRASLMRIAGGAHSDLIGSPQFTVWRTDDSPSGWAIEHASEARAPTCLDGHPLPLSVRVALNEGARITIGTALTLRVSHEKAL